MQKFCLCLTFVFITLGFSNCSKDQDNKPALPACSPQTSYGEAFAVLDPTYNRYEYELDSQKRPVSFSRKSADKVDERHVIQYNKEGQITKVTINYPYGTWLDYTLTYTTKGELATVVKRNSIDATGIKHSYTYNEKGQCIQLDVSQSGYTTAFGQYLYEYTGNIVKVTTMGVIDPRSSSKLVPTIVSTYEYYEQEDKLHYFKQYYFPSQHEEALQILLSGSASNDRSYAFSPLYRSGRSMLKSISSRRADPNQVQTETKVEFTYDYNAEGFPTMRTIKNLNSTAQKSAMITYTCK
jgi:hypothetical protein